MSIDSILYVAASRNIARHGVTVTLSRPADTSSGAAYNPTTGAMSGGTPPSNWTGTGYFSDYKTDEIDGTNIKVDDRKLYLSAKNLTRAPEINDLVDDTVKIISPVRAVRSGSTVLYYICQTRG